MRRVLLAATSAAFLALAAPAAASTLTLDGGTLTFTAAGGAANDVTLSGLSGVSVTVADADEMTLVPAGCTALSAGKSYACPGVTLVVVDVGDGDDTVDASALGVRSNMSGGIGSDELSGSTAADSLNGGAGDDTLDGNAGTDTLLGGDGRDFLSGGNGGDTVNGEGGDDTVNGDAGDDVAAGGSGDDSVSGGPGTDSVSGEDGDDDLFDDGGSDVLRGGAGFDSASLATRASVSVTIDGVGNDGGPGETANVLPDVEDVSVSASDATGTVTLVGSDAPNTLSVGVGKATIDGLAGADTILGSEGNDTVSARDGYPDRIRCYAGTDTVFADTLDIVSPSCENVQISSVPGPAGLDDQPPTVAWNLPAAAAAFRGNVATSLSVSAADDRGVAKVQFYDEDRLLCEVTAAPYACNYQARGADVGRNTLLAVATDSAGQATTAIRLVTVQPFAPALTLSLKPSRDKKAPYKFTASGTLSKAGACSGTVVVTAKAGKKTVSSRRAKVSSKCRYSISLSFKSRPASKLKLGARFEGNSSTAAKSATSKTARLG